MLEAAKHAIVKQAAVGHQLAASPHPEPMPAARLLHRRIALHLAKAVLAVAQGLKSAGVGCVGSALQIHSRVELLGVLKVQRREAEPGRQLTQPAHKAGGLQLQRHAVEHLEAGPLPAQERLMRPAGIEADRHMARFAGVAAHLLIEALQPVRQAIVARRSRQQKKVAPIEIGIGRRAHDDAIAPLFDDPAEARKDQVGAPAQREPVLQAHVCSLVCGRDSAAAPACRVTHCNAIRTGSTLAQDLSLCTYPFTTDGEILMNALKTALIPALLAFTGHLAMAQTANPATAVTPAATATGTTTAATPSTTTPATAATATPVAKEAPAATAAVTTAAMPAATPAVATAPAEKPVATKHAKAAKNAAKHEVKADAKAAMTTAAAPQTK